MTPDKPRWFAEHEKNDDDRFGDILTMLQKMDDDAKEWRESNNTKMSPIVDAFQALTTLGRWGKAVLALIAVLITIVVGLRGLR